MSPTLVLSIAVIALFFINFARKWKSWVKDPLSQFSGPFRLPMMGHLYTPARWSPKKVFHEVVSEWFVKYQSPSVIHLILRSPIVIVYDPENVQIIANRALDKGTDYTKFARFYGTATVTDNNHKMRRDRRKLMIPTISLKQMGSYYFNEYSRLNDRFAKELEVHADTGREIDLWPITQDSITHMFLASILKFDENDRKDIDVVKFNRSVPIVLEHLINRVFYPWLFSDIGSNLDAWIRGKQHYFRDFEDTIRKIREKLEARADSEGFDSIEDGEEGITGNEIVALFFPSTYRKLYIVDYHDETRKTFGELIYSKKGHELYSPDMKMEEIKGILMGTTDLRAISVSFTLLMLAMHEDSQEKVFEEISSVLGGREDEITMDDFSRLAYLDQCIKETLRLFPSIPWVVRRTATEVTLKDGRVLPSGSNVLLAIIGLHRDPAVYENPTMWIPDRFLPDQVEKRHPCSFIPFSIGGRKCWGYDNAFLSIKSQVVSFVKQYKLTTNMKLSDIELNFDLHLRNDAGFRVYLQKRNSH